MLRFEFDIGCERFAFVFFDLALDWTFTQVSRLIALLPPL